MSEALEGLEHIRAIVWDFDGVLNRAGVAGADGLFRWQHRMAQEFGTDTTGLARQVFGQDVRALMTGKEDILDRLDIWVRESGFEGDADDLLELWFESELDVDRELLQVVARLDQSGLTQVIATNNDPRRARYISVEAGWAEKVDAVFASGEMGVMKPDAEFYAQIEAALGLEAAEILMIDDSERNADAAEKRGWLAWHYQPGGALALAQAIMPLLLRAEG